MGEGGDAADRVGRHPAEGEAADAEGRVQGDGQDDGGAVFEDVEPEHGLGVLHGLVGPHQQQVGAETGKAYGEEGDHGADVVGRRRSKTSRGGR